jgi:DNA-binding XRE family transcriptional regulator
MPKKPQAIESMPPAVLAQLRQLGDNLAIARKRRRESRKVWAARVGVSEPTITRMERGDPGVAIGIYATALWLIGRAGSISALAAPEHDAGALEDAVRAAQARSLRKPASIEGRLKAGQGPNKDGS